MEILKYVITALAAALGSFLSLKIASGTLFEFTPAKIDLNKIFEDKKETKEKTSEVNKELTEALEKIQQLQGTVEILQYLVFEITELNCKNNPNIYSQYREEFLKSKMERR